MGDPLYILVLLPVLCHTVFGYIDMHVTAIFTKAWTFWWLMYAQLIVINLDSIIY